MKTRIIIPVAIATLFWSIPLFAAVTFSESQGQAFGGEKCIRCHSDKPAIQPQAPSESFDVVIVGGGMAGLSTLHYLRDVNAVVLETQERVGGQMLYNTWQGVRYAEGAAYMVEPYGILGEFYRTEKIPLIKIPEPDNNAWIRGKFYPNCWTAEGRGKMPWSRREMKKYVQFCEELEEVNRLSLSSQPFEFFSDEQQQLDRLPAKLWMQQKGLNDEMIELFDRYTASCFGVGANLISASAFANYLSGEIGGNLTVPGGLGAVTEIIYQNHKDRVRLSCHVLRIEQDLREARVIYLDPQGRQQTVRAKAVVAAVPCNLLPDLIPELPKEKRKSSPRPNMPRIWLLRSSAGRCCGIIKGTTRGSWARSSRTSSTPIGSSGRENLTPTRSNRMCCRSISRWALKAGSKWWMRSRRSISRRFWPTLKR